MPHGRGPGSEAELKDSASRFVKSPGGIGEVPRGITSVAGAALALVEANAEADLSVASLPLIAAIGEALGLSVGWVIFLGILAVLALLRIVEFALVKICDGIPWNFGQGPKAFITALFHPLDVAENWCIQQLLDGAQQLIALIIRAAELSFGLFFGNEVNKGAAPDSVTIRHMLADIKTLNNEVRALNSEVKQLDNEIALNPFSITGGISPTPAPSPATNPANYPSIGQFQKLAHRITAIANVLPIIIHDINVIESNQHQYATDLNSLKNELTGLEANIGAVRSVQLGVQDTLGYLNSTVRRLDFDYGQLAPQVQAHTNQLHAIHPLEQLLFLGQAGLSNLKKLEQNICQCPKYPGLEGDAAGGLALYEFLSNG